MKKILSIIILQIVFTSGCSTFRLEPTEEQKQNAWLHNRTAQMIATTAEVENLSQKILSLSKLNNAQSQAIVYDYGMPKQLPQADTTEQILSDTNWQITEAALTDSGFDKSDAWDVADAAMELGIGVAALLGGVYGVRFASFLRSTRTKSQALREIIKGNEIFKSQNTELTDTFKNAQKNQSPETRQIVAELKN